MRARVQTPVTWEKKKKRLFNKISRSKSTICGRQILGGSRFEASPHKKFNKFMRPHLN
jgi:hypothetical protein